MNLYTLLNFFAAVLIVTAGLLAVIKNRQSRVNSTFFLLTLSACIWQIGTGLALLTKSPYFSETGTKIGFFGIVLIPIFSYHLSLCISGSTRRVLLISGYMLAFLLFIPLSGTSLMLNGVYAYSWGYFFRAGPAHPLFMIYFISYMVLVFINLFLSYVREVSPLEKNRKKYFLFALFLAYIGSVDYLPTYGINIYPFGYLMLLCFILIFAYAIMRYRLMDIDVLIKKTLVFTSLFTIVFGMFVGITLVIQQFIPVGGNLLRFAVSSLVIIFTVRPLEIFLVRITDKYLFQKKYDYKHLITEFMDELKTMVLNTNDIAQSTVDFINASIRPTNSAIFMHNRFTSRYDLIASSDFKDETFNIPDNAGVVKTLIETNNILNVKKDSKSMLTQGKNQFAELGIEAIIPLLIHKELIGILCLGKKRSDEDYAEDDIEALSGLSGALSISLNNAQLFDERADAEKRALVGTIATGINHEVGNPLNIITIKLDTFRILAKEGLLAKKSKEEIIENVNEIAKVCLESAQRIAEITKQVSEFAKPDKKLVFDKVNINEAIDETIAFLKNGMILDIGKIEKQIICEPAYVTADRGQLKQILFNLIKNASHAIDKEKGKIIINVDSNGNGEVIIKIIDNGHGMPKEVMDRVFTPFFTTKEPGKGTGLGLSLVKIMIDRNDGKIKVESREGKGTTFTLVFKGGLL